MEEEEDSRR